MKIHKEGYRTIVVVSSCLIMLNLGLYWLAGLRAWGIGLSSGASIFILAFFTQFFRNPYREIMVEDNVLCAPADGTVVAIEETMENEYFNDKRLQLSIFMSPLNVHNNRSPVSGEITFSSYHPGKSLVAWHPKSSELNERSTIVIKCPGGDEVLMRQIAGAVARRIVTYSKVGDKVEMGEEIGFIKFGSRVDLFLPPGTSIDVSIGDKCRSGITRLSTNFQYSKSIKI